MIVWIVLSKNFCRHQNLWSLSIIAHFIKGKHTHPQYKPKNEYSPAAPTLVIFTQNNEMHGFPATFFGPFPSSDSSCQRWSLTEACEGSQRPKIYGLVKILIVRHTHTEYKIKTENNTASCFAAGRAWFNNYRTFKKKFSSLSIINTGLSGIINSK